MGNGPSSLHQAALNGELEAVRLAIQHNPSEIDLAEPTNAWTALHISASKGYEVIVRELLARGAAPNLVDKDGRTALHLCAGQGHATVIRDLLRKGADPLRRDMAGKTPLDVAMEQQQPAAASILAEALAGRGVSTTSSDSPTKAQGGQAAGYPFGAAAAAGGFPNIGGLDIRGGGGGMANAPALTGGYSPSPAAAAGGGGDDGGWGGGGGGGSAYPSVPPPLNNNSAARGMDWLHQLPVPPAAAGPISSGPVSMAAPSAPPVSGTWAQQQQQPWQQQQPQPQQAAVDYYDFIVPTPPPAAAPAAAGSSPYPAVPSAAPDTAEGEKKKGGLPWWRGGGGQQKEKQQQQPAAAPPQPSQPPMVQQQPPQPPIAQQHQQQLQRADSDDGWGGGGGGDDWGDDDGPAAPAAAAAAAGGGGGGGGSSHDKKGQQQQQQQPLNVNAAVGAAVSGAGKVAGAVGSIAVAGAKQLLTGLMKPGQGGDSSDIGSAPGSPSSAAATWQGTPGRTYTYGELAAATGGFSDANKLGAGGYGPVFRGVLDGLPVAVKLLDPAATGGQQGPKEFQSEVAILSRLHHPHIVLLIGSCPERCALVYELLDYGSLELHLFNPSMPELSWQDRVRMACEVASALVFLHSAPEPIIHMDLKPGNLLLNRSLLCKVGDVGLSRLMPGAARGRTAGGAGSNLGGPSGPVSTVMDSRLVGTPCYMDPEYLRTGRFGPKSDVYSLGVILLQMLTGLEASRVVAVVEAALARSQHDAASFATIIDPRSGSWPITEAASFAHLAVRCVALTRAQRPDLRGEVLPALLQLAQRSKLYTNSSGASVKRSLSLSHGSSSTPPSMMVCPITQDVMDDPVFAADGYTYERIAIAAWISSHNTSPMTNLPLADSRLTPNLALRSAIKEWQERHSGSTR